MMGYDDWRAYVKAHGLQFKYEGLSSRGRRDFFDSVGDAAAADEAFMDDYLYKDLESNTEYFEEALKARKDIDDLLTRYYDYLLNEVSVSEWFSALPGGTPMKDPSLETILTIIDTLGNQKRQDAFVENYLRTDPQDAWDMLRSDGEAEYLLKDHPPIEVFSHAYDSGIPLEDVFFVCPACHGEPQTESDLLDMYGRKNGYPAFYCGSCGSEMSVGRLDNILDFFNALEVVPYPFNDEKRAIWQAHMAERKARGENKLCVKPGDLVYLEATVEDNDGYIRHQEQPGPMVRVTEVNPAGFSWEDPDNKEIFGGTVWRELWSFAEPVTC